MNEQELRDALAQILWAEDSGRDDVPLSTTRPGTQRVYARVASRLLPVVRQFAAEALRDAADVINQDGEAASLMEYDELAGGHYRSCDFLRARADELSPSAAGSPA